MNQIYKHPNGYSAKLYGKSSMVVFNPDGKECSHTGFRSCNTEEEVMEMLESMPELMNVLKSIAEDDFDDEDDV